MCAFFLVDTNNTPCTLEAAAPVELRLPPEVWSRVAVFSRNKRDLWSLTATCRDAHAARTDPTAVAGWLLQRHGRYGAVFAAVSTDPSRWPQPPRLSGSPSPPPCNLADVSDGPSGSLHPPASSPRPGGAAAACPGPGLSLLDVVSALLDLGAVPCKPPEDDDPGMARFRDCGAAAANSGSGGTAGDGGVVAETVSASDALLEAAEDAAWREFRYGQAAANRLLAHVVCSWPLLCMEPRGAAAAALVRLLMGLPQSPSPSPSRSASDCRHRGVNQRGHGSGDGSVSPTDRMHAPAVHGGGGSGGSSNVMRCRVDAADLPELIYAICGCDGQQWPERGDKDPFWLTDSGSDGDSDSDGDGDVAQRADVAGAVASGAAQVRARRAPAADDGGDDGCGDPRTEVVRLLLQHGCGDGTRPYRMPQDVAELVGQGQVHVPRPSFKTKNRNALFRAAERGLGGIIRLLADAGWPVHGVDYGGLTPLHQAAWAIQPRAVRALLRGGADADALGDPALNSKRHTALHVAAAALNGDGDYRADAGGHDDTGVTNGQCNGNHCIHQHIHSASAYLSSSSSAAAGGGGATAPSASSGDNASSSRDHTQIEAEGCNGNSGAGPGGSGSTACITGTRASNKTRQRRPPCHAMYAVVQLLASASAASAVAQLPRATAPLTPPDDDGGSMSMRDEGTGTASIARGGGGVGGSAEFIGGGGGGGGGRRHGSVARDRGVHARNEPGYTPLHLAVLAGNVHAVHALLDAGADVEARDRAGCTPLMALAIMPDGRRMHAASRASCVACVAALLRHGARVGVGRSPGGSEGAGSGGGGGGGVRGGLHGRRSVMEMALTVGRLPHEAMRMLAHALALETATSSNDSPAKGKATAGTPPATASSSATGAADVSHAAMASAVLAALQPCVAAAVLAPPSDASSALLQLARYSSCSMPAHRMALQSALDRAMPGLLCVMRNYNSPCYRYPGRKWHLSEYGLHPNQHQKQRTDQRSDQRSDQKRPYYNLGTTGGANGDNYDDPCGGTSKGAADHDWSAAAAVLGREEDDEQDEEDEEEGREQLLHRRGGGGGGGGSGSLLQRLRRWVVRSWVEGAVAAQYERGVGQVMVGYEEQVEAALRGRGRDRDRDTGRGRGGGTGAIRDAGGRVGGHNGGGMGNRDEYGGDEDDRARLLRGNGGHASCGSSGFSGDAAAARPGCGLFAGVVAAAGRALAACVTCCGRHDLKH